MNYLKRFLEFGYIIWKINGEQLEVIYEISVLLSAVGEVL